MEVGQIIVHCLYNHFNLAAQQCVTLEYDGSSSALIMPAIQIVLHTIIRYVEQHNLYSLSIAIAPIMDYLPVEFFLDLFIL